MENITIGQLNEALKFLVEFFGLLITVYAAIKKAIEKHLKKLELSTIKTELVNFINDVEMGVFKTHIQRMHAHELYDRYDELGGNSYVHEHWEQLLKEGKI